MLVMFLFKQKQLQKIYFGWWSIESAEETNITAAEKNDKSLVSGAFILLSKRFSMTCNQLKRFLEKRLEMVVWITRQKKSTFTHYYTSQSPYY